DFSVDERLERLRENGFSKKEIGEIRKALISLTNNIVQEKVAPIQAQIEKLKELEKRRNYLIKHNDTSIYTVKNLLKDCKKFGTLPFSNLARYAFVSVSILKSLVHVGVITESQHNEFLQSIDTVATNTVKDLEMVNNGKLTKEEFLQTYGHLRPGTYDITSP